MRRSYTVTREQHCSIHIDVDSIGALVQTGIESHRLYFVVDEAVLPTFMQRVDDLGFDPTRRMSVIQGGEGAKTFDVYRKLLSDLERNNVLRRDSLVCVGGGALSDVAGFVAATYLRGIDYVNVPTTIMSQVDGGVGGKVAINTCGAKNAVGAFWHPTDVYVDHSWLKTLPPEEVAHGFAESVKVACIEGSGELFELMESTAERLVAEPATAASDVIRLSIEAKVKLVQSDPFERDLRRLLNLGHTVGHSLEAATGFGGIHHGGAVAIGISVACRYGRRVGLSNPDYVDRVINLISRLGLPISVHPDQATMVLGNLDAIRQVRDGFLHYVVPTEPGRAVILPAIEVDALYQSLVGE